MKANRKAKKLGNDDSAAVGIGTMIVFIAMVIVAAVAAAVLINTAGNLQRKAQKTGADTQNEVSSNLFLRDIVGHVNTTSSQLNQVNWYISLAPGAQSIDLSQLIVRWNDGTNLYDLAYNSTGTTNCTGLTNGFCIVSVKDTDNNVQVLSPGDRVRIYVGLNSAQEIATRSHVDALFIPEQGSPVTGAFDTPSTYGTSTYVDLMS